MKLLALALPHHDANLALLDGDRARYLKLERTRQHKRYSPDSVLEWPRLVRQAFGVAPETLDDVVFCFDPGALPAAVRSGLTAEGLGRLAAGRSPAEPLDPALCRHLGVPRGWLVSHHLAHALDGWMLEGYEPTVRIVIDGLGDGRPWSVYRGQTFVAGGDIRRGSIGWGIREAGKLLDVAYGHYNDIAGKVMGLQSHGRVDQDFLHRLRAFDIDSVGEVWSIEHWKRHRGDPLVARWSLLDWVATVHQRMEEVLVDFFARHAQPGDVIAYSGGVAQNVVWNSALRRAFPRLTVPPHASDEGLSLGALEWLRRHHGLPPLQLPGFPYAQEDEAPSQEPSARTLEHAAGLLARGRTVGWFQGRGEIGPRALGNRSILVDPRQPDARERLNRIKRREAYRPFGASVLDEHFGDHFEGEADEFMMYACRVIDPALASIRHVDGSSRVQRVTGRNPPLRALLQRFHALTGCPVLANTSLNVAGKPLAAFPETARQVFHDADIDAMVVGDEVLLRSG
jgi:carbamoyltransferase